MCGCGGNDHTHCFFIQHWVCIRVLIAEELALPNKQTCKHPASHTPTGILCEAVAINMFNSTSNRSTNALPQMAHIFTFHSLCVLKAFWVCFPLTYLKLQGETNFAAPPCGRNQNGKVVFSMASHARLSHHCAYDTPGQQIIFSSKQQSKAGNSSLMHAAINVFESCNKQSPSCVLCLFGCFLE